MESGFLNGQKIFEDWSNVTSRKPVDVFPILIIISNPIFDISLITAFWFFQGYFRRTVWLYLVHHPGIGLFWMLIQLEIVYSAYIIKPGHTLPRHGRNPWLYQNYLCCLVSSISYYRRKQLFNMYVWGDLFHHKCILWIAYQIQ